MEVVRLVTGNWFPRTRLHLAEYYRFLQDGTSQLPIDRDQLKRAREKLDPKNVAYVGLAAHGRFDRVDAEVDTLHTVYFEDGLFLASKKVTRVEDDLFRLQTVYNDRCLTALTLLFSVGLPAITVYDPRYTQRPTVLVAKSGTESEVRALLATYQETPHFTAAYSGCRVYLGEQLIVVVTKEPDSHRTEHLVMALVFFQEYESRLRHFLNLHREVWQSIEKIRNRPNLPLKDLPQIRDHLLDYDRDLSTVSARLAQMSHYLDERKTEFDEMGLATYLRSLQAYRFGKMRVSTQYLIELWDQLDEYIESTANIIGLMYQEQIEKSLNALQFIFLVGTVAGLLTLGSLGVTETLFFDADGEVTGRAFAPSFGVGTLSIFVGVSFLISLMIYLGVKVFTANIQRIKPSHLLGERPILGSDGARKTPKA